VTDYMYNKSPEEGTLIYDQEYQLFIPQEEPGELVYKCSCGHENPIALVDNEVTLSFKGTQGVQFHCVRCKDLSILRLQRRAEG